MKYHIIPIFALLILLSPSCITDFDGGSFFGKGIEGEGPLTSKTLGLEGFTAVSIGTAGELFLSQGEVHSVKVESQQNIIDNLDAKVSGEQLKLGFDKPVKSYESLKFYITMPTLKGLNIAGSADVTGDTPFTGLNATDINIAGSGNVELELEASSIEISIAGSGDVRLDGSANTIDVSIMGSGSVKAGQLKTQKADVSIAGSGDCTIDATDQLSVSIAGSGDVYYFGSPEIDKSIAGSGNVEKK